MKHLFVIAGILFSTPAVASEVMSPVNIANDVAKKLATTNLDVIEFMDFKCSVKIKSKDKIPEDNSCKAHVVSSKGSTTVYEFFFNDVKKEFSLRTTELKGTQSNSDQFSFNAYSIQFFGGKPKAIKGSCVSDARANSTECHAESTDGSDMSVDISVQHATMAYIKVDGKEMSTGLDL